MTGRRPSVNPPSGVAQGGERFVFQLLRPPNTLPCPPPQVPDIEEVDFWGIARDAAHHSIPLYRTPGPLGPGIRVAKELDGPEFLVRQFWHH